MKNTYFRGLALFLLALLGVPLSLFSAPQDPPPIPQPNVPPSPVTAQPAPPDFQKPPKGFVSTNAAGEEQATIIDANGNLKIVPINKKPKSSNQAVDENTSSAEMPRADETKTPPNGMNMQPPQNINNMMPPKQMNQANPMGHEGSATSSDSMNSPNELPHP